MYTWAIAPGLKETVCTRKAFGTLFCTYTQFLVLRTIGFIFASYKYTQAFSAKGLFPYGYTPPPSPIYYHYYYYQMNVYI